MSGSVPEHLVKFMTANTATDVLANSTLRWSAPDCLGDPFELNSQSTLGFDAALLLESTIKLASSMIFAPEEPKGESPLINAINRWREEERFDSAEEAHGVLRELLSKMVDYRVSQLDASMSQWQSFARNARYCCFCASPHILAAWEACADNHKGFALRFNCGESSPYKLAKPVVYQNERAEFTTLREQLGAILHNRKDRLQERFLDHHYIKATYHKHEEEWRCYQTSPSPVSVEDQDQSAWFDDLPFPANHLNAVFIGLAAPEEDKQRVLQLVREKFVNTKVFQAVKGKTGFTLEFEKVELG